MREEGRVREEEREREIEAMKERLRQRHKKRRKPVRWSPWCAPVQQITLSPALTDQPRKFGQLAAQAAGRHVKVYEPHRLASPRLPECVGPSRSIVACLLVAATISPKSAKVGRPI